MGQLRMIWDAGSHELPTELPLDGFRISCNGPEAKDAYVTLRKNCGWCPLPNPDFLKTGILPDGLILCEDVKTGLPVASATAEWSHYSDHPDWGTLGWVMCLEAYRGKKLGLACVIESMKHSVKAGYKRIALLTDDFRLPAIRLYLQLGWAPYMLDDDMPERWQKICEALNWNIKDLHPVFP